MHEFAYVCLFFKQQTPDELRISGWSSDVCSSDRRVIGTITPPSCTPTLTGGGIVDYGKIFSSKLSMTAYNRLSTKDVPFSIVCTGPARIAVRATDNRSSSQIAGILTTSGSGVGIADEIGRAHV